MIVIVSVIVSVIVIMSVIVTTTMIVIGVTGCDRDGDRDRGR